MIIGLDMGGTNIDAVLVHNGEIIETSKSSTEHGNLLDSIWYNIKNLLRGQDSSKIERIILSTTVSTNAIIEKKTEPVGMIIECGPGLQREFLCCGRENVFLSGYIDHRGREVAELNPQEIRYAINVLKRSDIKAVAVVGKFSVRNNAHEIKIKGFLEKEFSPITLGHTLSGKLNFPRRVFTSYYNSAVYSTFKNFSHNIQKALQRENIKAPVYVLKADGGTTSLNASKTYPVNTILSGPAASVMGGQAFFDSSEDAVFLDIGGTTTDISFLADGVPLFEPWGIKIGDYPTLVRALYSVSIGVGGDSKVAVNKNKIIIGPERQGPPQALGGSAPTPTDAMIVLGLLNIGEKQKAAKAMSKIGEQLGLNPEETSKKVLDEMANIITDSIQTLLDIINSHPVYTVKELLQGKKIIPKVAQLIGGPAKVMAPILSRKLGIPCRYPKVFQVANAVGAALARTTTEITMYVDTAQQTLIVPEMGIHEKIDNSCQIEKLKDKALDLVKQRALALGARSENIQAEIIEISSFNMVRGFYTSGKNIRIRAQVKPGITLHLRSDINAES